MRRNNLLVYDDMVPPGTATVTVFSPAVMNAKLAQYDQIALMAVVDNLNNASNKLDIWVAHSSDQRNWMYRQGNATTRPGTGDIHFDASGGGNPLSTTATNVGQYLDGGKVPGAVGPFLAFIRLEIEFGGSGATGGHVRIYATQRDQGA
jgi:hypothetical protein